jgi:23S rRNA-/tRNA-specific pseudouridylate synthase
MLLPVNVNYIKAVNWFRSQYTLKSKHLNLKADSIDELYKDKHFLILNKPYDLIVYDYNKKNPSQITFFNFLKEKYPYHYDPVSTYIFNK